MLRRQRRCLKGQTREEPKLIYASTSKQMHFGLKLPWAKELSTKKRSDKDLRDELLETLRHCPSLSDDQIDVRVENGRILLVGEVSSHENKSLAVDAAWSIQGAIGVKSWLRVQG